MLDFGLPKQTIDCLIEYFKSKPAIDKILIFGSREGSAPDLRHFMNLHHFG